MKDKIEDIELIGIVEGTVDDLKQYVRDNDLEKEQLEKILQVEKDAKDRKTAKRFLKRRIKKKDENKEENSDESGEELNVEDEEIDREELLKILGGTVEDMKEYIKDKDPSDSQLQEILHAEKVVNDRTTAVRFLKSYSRKEELKEDIRKAEHDFQELREDLDRIEDEVLDEDIELSGIDLEDIEEDKKAEETENEKNPEPAETEEKEEENDSEKDSEEPEETGDEDESSESSEETTDGEESEEAEQESDEETDDKADEDSTEDDEDGKEDEIERKREIAEDLDADLSDDDLKDIPLEELKAIRDEKVEREELIDYLRDEFDEERLRDASTDDLRKLKKDLDSAEGEDTPEKEGEDIKEEAQEDLEMLMGAVKEKDTEKESKDRLSGIKDLRLNIRDKLSFRGGGDDDEEEDKGMPKGEVIDLLEDYQELEKYESAIKTAHIMKGFLEYSEGIERELTYRELTEEIEAGTDEMETLMNFFDNMHKDQYTGDITADMDEVIESAKKVVEKRG